MSLRSSEDNLIIQYANLQATTVACDCTGQYGVLCGPKLFALINLDNPKDVLKTYHRNHRHKFCAVQWNPHSFYSNIFLIASNQYVDLWSYDTSTSSASQRSTLKGHTRPVNDFDWSPVDPNIAITCSADTNTCLWDIRECRRPSTTLQSVLCPSQVKWNQLRERVLATTHEGDLRIWDLRKSNTPVNYISAHEQKVTGLEWSPFSDRQVATCSEDGSVKFWDINSQKQEEDKIQSDTAFWKLKYTPFGNGVVTSYVPQMGGNLCFWTLNKMLSNQHRQPLCTLGYHGGQGVTIDFCWRPVDGDYQLLSWADNDSLRLVRIDPLIKQRCGNSRYASFQLTSSCGSTPDREIMDFDSNEAIQLANEKLSGNTKSRRRGTHTMPLPPDELSVESARTLMKEFTLLNCAIPDLTITEMSAETQTLVVSVVKGSHKVHLMMSFPNSYPNRVAPEFHLLEDTTLDRPFQEKLVEDLQNTAFQHVQHSRGCIEPCLWRLVNRLDVIIQESQTSPDTDSNYLPMQEIWSLFSTEKLRDENIPFPRISGARFCGPGFLVCFTRRMFLDVPSTSIVPAEQNKRKQSESGITPRSMSALSEMTQPTRIPSGANIMRNFMGSAKSLPSDSSVPSVSQYYQMQDQKPQKSKNKTRTRDQKQDLRRTSSGSKKNPVGPVIIYDLSCLLPVQKLLGENYKFDSRDPVSMCRKNTQVANSAGRKDLVQVWSLAAVQLAQSTKCGIYGDRATPWSLHPFGQRLIKFWFDYYISIRDVQTLAMLCCAFGSGSQSKSYSPVPATSAGTSKPSTASNSANVNFNTYHTIHSTDTSLKGWNYMVRKMRRSNSWSEVMFEAISPSLDSNFLDGEVHLENAEKDGNGQNTNSLLEPQQHVQHDLFKKAYANILLQWGLMYQQAELLKFVSGQSHDLTNNYYVDTLSSETKDTWTSSVTVALNCVLCRMKVKGLASLCMACGHGGHTMHMIEWFTLHDYCASGCGCKCTYENQPEFSTA